MNKAQIQYRKEQEYSEKIPAKEGLWLMVCGENSNIADYVAITKKGQEFMTHDKDFGVCGLKTFHNGLTHPMWRFVA
jgi:hypothetical protein